MKKTILPLCAALLLSAGLVSCGGDPADDSVSTKKIHLSLWVPTEQVSWATARTEAFKAANASNTYEISVTAVQEGDVQTQIKQDPEASADVFFYAGDHLGPLVDGGYLAEFPASAVTELAKDIPESVLSSAKVGGKLYGIPYTPNSYFMYYDGTKLTADEAKSLDTILEKGKMIFDVDNGWYQTAFWYGTGVRFFGEDGMDPTTANLDSEAGYAAARAIRNYTLNANFINGGDDEIKAQFIKNNTDNIVAVVGGSWLSADLINTFGNDLKATVLPTFTEGDQTYNMMATGDWKKCGVSKYTDNQIEAFKLAMFLTNADSMLEKLSLFNETPVLDSLSENDAVKNNVIVSALMEQTNTNCVRQPAIAQMSNWWDAATSYANALLECKTAGTTIDDAACAAWAKQLQENLLATIAGN